MLLVGMQNGTDPLEGSLVVYYKTKHSLTIQSINFPPWYLLKGAENLHPHKTCRRMFIAASKTWRQQRCLSVSEWLNKLW